MGMVIKYVNSGTYTFDDDTTLAPIARNFTFDAQGRRDREEQTWSIRTILQDTDGAGLDAKASTLVSKMTNGGTLTLYLPGGSTSTIHTLADCQIRSINFPESTGAEYARQRTVDIQITGYLDSTKADEVVTFQESLNFTGGGPRYALQETITGTPVKHRTAENTIFYATQTGSATARDTFPTPPGPAFPGDELDGNPDINYTTNRTPDGSLRYTTTWTYRFASALELQGVPSTWA